MTSVLMVEDLKKSFIKKVGLFKTQVSIVSENVTLKGSKLVSENVTFKAKK